MITYKYNCPDGRTVRIHHNGDFSGDAIVTVAPPGHPVTKLLPEFEVPCDALVAFAGDAMRAVLTRALDDIVLPYDPAAGDGGMARP